MNIFSEAAGYSRNDHLADLRQRKAELEAYLEPTPEEVAEHQSIVADLADVLAAGR